MGESKHAASLPFGPFMLPPGQNSPTTDCAEVSADGDFQRIWQMYSAHVMEYARQQLGSHPQRDADGEDVFLSAMASFYRGLAEQRFDVSDQDGDLWNLLCLIVRRTVSNRLRYHYADKRGQGTVRGDSVFARGGGKPGVGFDQVAAPDALPASAEELRTHCSELLELLNEKQLRLVALRKLEGFTNEEIAAELNCGLRSVERKLHRIRLCWRELVD